MSTNDFICLCIMDCLDRSRRRAKRIRLIKSIIKKTLLYVGFSIGFIVTAFAVFYFYTL